LQVKLVIETSEIIRRQFTFEGPYVKILEKAIGLGKVELVIPQIVLEETRNKYREALQEAENAVTKSRRKLNSLLANEMQLPVQALDREAAVEAFVARFERRLSDLRAIMPEYNDIPQTDVVSRELARRRPFREGRGYRDTLIWETILRRVVTKNDQAVLVTLNKNDFCAEGTSNTLHPDLVDDLVRSKLKGDAVDICASTEDFVDK
jgi:PIN domain-containing protein